MRHSVATAFMTTAALLAVAARSEVVATSANAASIRIAVPIAAPPGKVYASFLAIGRWWNKEHTYSGDAANLKLTATPGGCFCESLPGGGGVQHMTVVYVAPNQRVTLSGALGPLQSAGIAGSMTFSFVPKDAATELVLVYNFAGSYPNGLPSIAASVDEVLQSQMARLKRLVETGVADEKAAGPARP
ncbi:MAG TPA: hypothetical protein VE046_00665 [Steroidobacteraceae bacterium]|nr:hypothetical protein [Steroidobacteraceae bacterium]